MKRMVFGESVQGASHKRVDKECQDSFKKLEYDDGTVIMAIADGHGSKACPYSKSGSSIAVNVFCKVMDEFHASYAENLEMLLTYLNREGDTLFSRSSSVMVISAMSIRMGLTIFWRMKKSSA